MPQWEGLCTSLMWTRGPWAQGQGLCTEAALCLQMAGKSGSGGMEGVSCPLVSPLQHVTSGRSPMSKEDCGYLRCQLSGGPTHP